MMKFFWIFFVVLLIPGCFETKQAETKSVSWYIENQAERKVKLIECNDNPGELGNTPNCLNAKQAELQSTSKGQNTRF